MSAAMFFAGLIIGLLVMDVYRDRVEIHQHEQWLDAMEQFQQSEEDT